MELRFTFKRKQVFPGTIVLIELLLQHSLDLPRQRGVPMSQPILVEYFQEIPDRKEGENARRWAQRFQAGLDQFKQAVKARYNEGTLERLLSSPSAQVRQAAALGLGMIGTWQANESLAAMLRDDHPLVRQVASDSLWSLWFRASTPENNKELQRLMRLKPEEVGFEPVLRGYLALIEQAPKFAEAYNQRAILYFRMGDMPAAIADCTMALRLNPHHFGAASGLAQCYMKQKKLRAALRSYRRAHRINPSLDGVEQVIHSLERMLGEERK
jgi:tetratricopeptide (TPR) repeat protein